MPRVVQIPDIRKVDLPEARQAIPKLHGYLRECILDGTLTPGMKLSQVSLARRGGGLWLPHGIRAQMIELWRAAARGAGG